MKCSVGGSLASDNNMSHFVDPFLWVLCGWSCSCSNDITACANDVCADNDEVSTHSDDP